MFQGRVVSGPSPCNCPELSHRLRIFLLDKNINMTICILSVFRRIPCLSPFAFRVGAFLIDLGFVYWVCFGLPGKVFFEILDPLSEQDLLLSARKSSLGLPFQNPICAPVYTIHCIIMYNHECMYILYIVICYIQVVFRFVANGQTPCLSWS